MNRSLTCLAAALAPTFSLAPSAQAQFGDTFQVNGSALRGKITEAGDIDGDGDQDVLIGDIAGRVAWRPNLGAGSFGEQQLIVNLVTVDELFLADLDGDSDLDLIVLATNGASVTTVSWFEFLGTGEFGPRVTLGACRDAAVADIDGDGDLDVLACSFSNLGVFYFENLGSGVISTTSTMIDPEPVLSVGVADLDGDGDQDVVTGLFGSHPFGLGLFENEGGGSWTKSSVINVGPAARYEDFAFGDLDGDGELDIVAAARTGLFDWYDQFAPMEFRNRQQFYVGTTQGSMDIGDMDSDGDLDILMFGTDVDWQENLGGGAFATHPVADPPGSTGTARLADLDGSGTLDVLYSFTYGPDATLWKPNLGSGMFGPPESLSELELHYPSVMATADFDGDGDLDVAGVSYQDRQAVMWENLGQDEFSSARKLSGPHDVNHYAVDIIAADVDGDGDSDVVIAAGAVYWCENRGSFTGEFEPRQTLWNGGFRTDALVPVDLNGDGLMDIVGNAPASRQVYVLYGVAGGPDGSAPTLMGALQWDPIALAAADFDGDGDVDVAARIEFGSGCWLIETLPGGAFAPAVRVAGDSLVPEPRSLLAADLDQDGHQDLMTGGLYSVVWSRGLGDGTFGPSQGLPVVVAPDWIYSTAIADVDGDSRLDVLASSQASSGAMPDTIIWSRNLGMGSFGPGGSLVPDRHLVSDILVADFDGDLDGDLLVASRGDNMITVFRNVDGVGAGYCAPGNLHSGGRSASITGGGSTLIADDDLTLQAFDLPLNRAGYFLVSRTQGFVALPAGSQGNLCLGGSIGRYVQQVGNSGATGTLPLQVSAAAITQPLGAVTAMAGETWSFQCWFRDQVAGTSTSNFSSGFAVRFR